MQHSDQHNQIHPTSVWSEDEITAVIRQAAENVIARLNPPAPQSHAPQSSLGHVSQSPAQDVRRRDPLLYLRRFRPDKTFPAFVRSIPARLRRTLLAWRKDWTARNYRGLAGHFARAAVYTFAIWFIAVTALILVYRFVNPPASNLMIYNYLAGRDVKHEWVDLEDVSPAVIRAVIVAEDAQFCRHWGIDVQAIRDAIRNADGGIPRGASTISMQTAKNMFLWQSKSYVRKALEVPVTVVMEIIWPKKRMLEVYLNIAEWGPGIFGIQAAAKHHFKTTADKLDRVAAARLAAALPNPKVRRAGRPGPLTRRKAQVINSRARQSDWYTRCALANKD